MAQPGWLPDPGGQPGMFRYWDGAAWTQQLSADPPMSTPPGRKNRNGMILAIVVGVVLLAVIALFVAPRLVGGTGPTATRSAADRLTHRVRVGRDHPSDPDPTPTPTPSEPPETSLPCPKVRRGRGQRTAVWRRVSVPVIGDPRWDVNAVRSIPWAICATGLWRTIAPTGSAK